MPNGKLLYQRGEIWWVDLEPVQGSEANKTRPCLILQNDLGNQYIYTTIVAPFLRQTKNYPFVINVKATKQNGLDGNRGINISQMRAVDSQRVKSKLGVLDDMYWQEIEQAVLIELGFSPLFEQ